MSRIHRRSQGTWEVVLEQGHDPRTGKRVRRTFTVRGTKKDAEREAAVQVSAQASGTYVDPSKETVGEFLERWLRDYVEPSLALRTQLRYRDVVRNDLTPNLGNIPIQRLRPTHILAAEQALRATGNRKTGGPLAPATVRKIHNVLHRALSHAVAWQSIPLNPADAVDRPSIPASTPRVLSPDQARTLLAALDGHRFGLPLRTALLCGLRLSELLALRWADIDWNGGRMLVLQSLDSRHDGAIRFKATKTHRSARPVSVPPQLLEALREHRADQVRFRLMAGELWHDFDLVFANATGQPLTSGWIRKSFYRLLDDIGLPRLPLHGLRHTMATLMLAAGEHPKVVSERLGHSNPSFTLTVYGHVVPGMHEGASRRLEETLLPKA
ncbi:MAG TPA: site-specific integrase [Candidatus Saccharimonadales bacterium]|nr:site-specific integrase [Candidatus Saccharimonadales bacterium]